VSDPFFVISEPARSRLPAEAVEVFEGWVREGRDLSGFYEALLAGDHFRAAMNADGYNLAAFGLMVLVIGQQFPRNSYGSYAKLRRWRDSGRKRRAAPQRKVLS
jgi:hypothetical protein